MPKLIDRVTRYLEEEDWKYEQSGDSKLRTGVKGRNGRYLVIINASDERERIVCLSLSAVLVPEERLPAVMEFLTRANWGLVQGNFELDLDDGEVRYKTTCDVEGCEPTRGMIANLIRINVLTMDLYFKGLMAVAFSATHPAAALAEIEDAAGQPLPAEPADRGVLSN